ncbi:MULTISPECIES: peroxiredoxin [unclassified Nocardioides]|uniref:peroxiredoxin n=1 Tax=unclassified Nocardioides TaxID=2615069 RepID=UPI0006F95CF9|nr:MULTISPECIES: peroxiredoxin [unclassified Nocardioides]KQY64418.1 peroxiredoxin [Nocardioides sp. Root140]KRF18189.1 peroxiredoxin [Nocardioides sp. Soil796]
MKTLAAGQTAPDFELPDQDGVVRRLGTLVEDGPVVLFFYPAAMTAGCTKEACHFRDLGAEFAEAGVQRIGISTDAVEKQAEFSAKHGFDYPLLADVGGEVAASYGVKRSLIGKAKRSTFVIGRDRSIVKVISSELNMNVHADEALAAARAS